MTPAAARETTIVTSAQEGRGAAPPGDPLVLSETIGAVGVARFNRPKVLNALSPQLMDALAAQLEAWDRDDAIAVIVVTGDDRAFAAGADIGDMATSTAVEIYRRDPIAHWDRVQRIRKPIVAAVSGYALGGGCELAMICDVIVASETAQFGQPEINIGVMPGAGGTQRLARAVGKAKAMDMVLTGRMIGAREALDAGLVSRVVPPEHCFREAMRIAQEMARKGAIALQYAKAAILRAFETGLAEGVEYERKMFYALFATADQKEGMEAFLEKRPPRFTGR
jgi:enoyl-CoA hydratase